MEDIKIAILGLGRLGGLFLERLAGFGDAGPHIVCAVDTGDRAGRQKADALGIALVGIDELVRLGEDIDIIFALTDDTTTLAQLRHALTDGANRHTQILSENDVRLMEMILDAREVRIAA